MLSTCAILPPLVIYLKEYYIFEVIGPDRESSFGGRRFRFSWFVQLFPLASCPCRRLLVSCAPFVTTRIVPRVAVFLLVLSFDEN